MPESGYYRLFGKVIIVTPFEINFEVTESSFIISSTQSAYVLDDNDKENSFQSKGEIGVTHEQSQQTRPR